MGNLYPDMPSTESAICEAVETINDAAKLWRSCDGMQEESWTYYTAESFAVGIVLHGLQALQFLMVARGANQQADKVAQLYKQVGKSIDVIRDSDLKGEFNNEIRGY